MNKNNHASPFFIFGSPRSGTSLLSRMVDSHPELVVPNESLIFKMFSSFLYLYGDLNNLENQKKLLKDVLDTRVIGGYWTPKPIFEDIAPLISRPGFAGVIDALIRSRAMEKTLAAWGEKSPGHVFYWRQIKEAFPEAKIIHIVRDGRDVASSIIKARMGPKTYYAAARMWCDYLDGIENIKNDCNAENFIEISYENLLEYPKENLEKLCTFLNVDYNSSMLKFFEKDTNYNTDKANSTNLQKPLMSSNKEKWRENLNPPQLQEFETIASNHLERYEYKTANKLGPLSNLKLEIIKKITSPIIRFISRAKDTQGQLEFLSIKRIMLKQWLIHLMKTDH